MLNNQWKNVIPTVLFLVAAGSCSTTPKVQEFAETANSADELQRFKADMETAEQDQVNVLAPTSYQEAKKSLDSAVRDQKAGKPAKEILHEVASGRARLDRANQFAKVSRTNLEDVVEARNAAIKADAPKLFGKDFETADDHLRDVTSEIEDNDLGDIASQRARLQKEYMDVELRAIQKGSLGEARDIINAAVKEGANDYAKQSLAIAEKKYQDADAFIVANRHQTADVKARSDEAKDAATHLLKITRASKTGKHMTSEEAALRFEKEQDKTKDETDQLKAEKNTVKDLTQQTKNLKASEDFNQKFADAETKFSASEAEVYRQGNQLVIRLRSLAFPVNQSVLREANFPLLAKVAGVIGGFKNSKVVVEGHTDSDGGKATNQELSTARAQAITAYLVANQAVSQERVSSVGYGSERPLASNKTADGRAQNRRVDVVISPDQLSH